MFTGTLIDDLIAAVERAESSTQQLTPIEIEPCPLEPCLIEPCSIEPCLIEPWVIEARLASAQQNPDSEPKLLGVA